MSPSSLLWWLWPGKQVLFANIGLLMDSHFSVSTVARLHGLILFRLYGFAYDGFIVPVYDLLHVRFATVAQLWPVGKHLSMRLMNALPIFVWTFLLNGGSNHIIFLRLLSWFGCLCGAGLNLVKCIFVRGNFRQPFCWLPLGCFLFNMLGGWFDLLCTSLFRDYSLFRGF